MKRIQASLIALMCVVCAFASVPYTMDPEETLPEKSGFSKIEYNAGDRVRTLTATRMTLVTLVRRCSANPSPRNCTKTT